MLEGEHEMVVLARKVRHRIAKYVQFRASPESLPGSRALLLAGVMHEMDREVVGALEYSEVAEESGHVLGRVLI